MGHDVLYIQMYKNLNRDRSRLFVCFDIFVHVFVVLCELMFAFVSAKSLKDRVRIDYHCHIHKDKKNEMNERMNATTTTPKNRVNKKNKRKKKSNDTNEQMLNWKYVYAK